MNKPDQTPPFWAQRLLRWLHPPETLEEVEGDLNELYAYWHGRAGKTQATLRYLLNVVSVLPPFVRRRQRKQVEYQIIPLTSMLRNGFKTALRQLWRNRLTSGLNIVGLSIGLATSWVIYRMVSFEYSFDRDQPAGDRTYRVVHRYVFDGKEAGNPGVPLGMFEIARTQVPGVEVAVPMYEKRVSRLQVAQPGGRVQVFKRPKDIVATNPAYFQLIHYTFLSGSPAGFAQPGQVILTLQRAAQYFPGLSPWQLIGRELVYADTLPVRVVGVVANPPVNSDFGGQEFLSVATLKPPTEKRQWDGIETGDQLLLRLRPQVNPVRVEQQLNTIAQKHSGQALKVWSHYSRRHLLQPLSDLHLNAEYAGRTRTADKRVLNGLMGLAGFILLLAGINYVNLTTAQFPQRAREVGVRKTLGSSRGALMNQFLVETLLIVLMAFGVAVGLAHLFFIYFQDLLPPGVQTYIQWPLALGFSAGLVVVVTGLAGLYPGWLLSRFRPTTLLQSQPFTPVDGASTRIPLRQSLIVFQFVIAQAFIVGALLVGQQLRFALTQPLGFDREAVVLLRTPNPEEDRGRRFTLKQELQKLPGVKAVSLGDAPASSTYTNDTWTYQGKKGPVDVTLYRKFIDADYLPFYQVKLMTGRDLLPSDTVREYLLNEAACRAFGFTHPQDAIGKVLTEYHGLAFPVVGVVRDFHSQSFREKITPTVLMTARYDLRLLNLKLAVNDPNHWSQTLKACATIWKKFYPQEPFTYEFYDEQIATFYQQERALGRIVNLATAMAVLVSCLGLFGLATLTGFQRRKEIGVRKVLGATIYSIVLLLSVDFLKLVLLAMVIATPIGWWAIHQWLQGFAYQIQIEWWMFGLAGLLAVGIALLTVSFQSIKSALMNPVKSLRSE